MEVGKKLPKFSLNNQDGVPCTYNDLLGKKKVLYFYPKDDTPGCTKEACDFTTSLKDFNALDVAVYGVSPDSVAKHQAFKAKYNLKITLLSDETKTFCEACGVIREKSMYGKKFMGLVRTTFIIDETNKILHIFNNVKVTDHIEKILAKFKEF